MFQPALPFAGLSGWNFLQRTRDEQQQTFNQSAQIERDTEYFRATIGAITSASDLVADRRLLTVALGAFGLDDDINNKFFIQKILSDGTLKEDALANRLSDKRYLALSKAFGFGDFSVANTQLSDFPDKIISGFHERQFEIAIGEQNEEMRLAMGVQRDLADITAKESTSDGLWFSVMGNPPLRRVFEVAMGLPASLGSIDLDQQLSTFRAKSEQYFATSDVRDLAGSELQEKLVTLFLVRSNNSATVSPTTAGATAIALLENAGHSTSLLLS